MLPRVIAIDGPAGVGKTSLAERLAGRTGYRVYDTGALYRAATLLAARAGLTQARPDDEATIVRLIEDATIRVDPPHDTASEPVVTIDGEDVTAELRGPAVNRLVSAVSQLPGVRAALMAVQREAAASGGVIMVGRDMGTIVVPDADVKLYLDADLRVRAERRAKQLAERGRARPLAEIMREEAERDRIDSSRAVAPLRPAPDAAIIITDGLTPEEVESQAWQAIERATRRWGRTPVGEAG
jgi:cytidylate kinase